MDNKLLYDREVLTSYDRLGSEHKQILDWVGDDKKVLEIACHTGYFSTWLQNQGCKVTGVEIYEPALKKANPYLYRSIIGDVETSEVWEMIKEEKYDTVLFMHILEHLVNPEEVLEKTKQILNPGGQVIISLPNISNWNNRWDIFKGNFTYTETGIMDKTHLRFFNYYSAIEVIEKTGFKIEEYCGDSWKVRFVMLPEVRGFRRINKIWNNLVHRIAGPNITDMITMYKVSVL